MCYRYRFVKASHDLRLALIWRFLDLHMLKQRASPLCSRDVCRNALVVRRTRAVSRPLHPSFNTSACTHAATSLISSAWACFELRGDDVCKRDHPFARACHNVAVVSAIALALDT